MRVLRVYSIALLGIALVAGCADRDSRTTRRSTTDRDVAKPATSTDTPGNTTNRDLTATPGSTTTTRTETSERTVNKPVITDPNVKRDADNTGVNKRDADHNLTKTPIDQNENKKDIDITAAIRKRVTDTKASINAQNVKIITQDGKVTLRGPVKTDNEKQMIERIALDVAGEGNVENQLEVEKE